MKTIYLLLIALLVTTCDSDDTVNPASLLPPITMTGENTFGCLIDGKFFRPRDGGSTINSDNRGLRVVLSEGSNIELLVTDFKSQNTGSLDLHIEDLLNIGEGAYQVDDSNSLLNIDGNNNTYVHGRIYNSNTNRLEWYVSYENSGIIEVNRVTRNSSTGNIISGTFEVQMISIANPQDTVRIQSGRFDINTITLLQTNFN
jgi:hypothetical protein